MPVYEFKCNKCGIKFEEYFKSASEQKKLFCPSCQSEHIEKIFSVFGTSETGNGNLSSAGNKAGGGGCGCCAMG
ncbi:MAG: zinc ribbon domain-containing protein [Candidatus Kuenenia sp.]|nr:zinc ribbon domain-containing protein [Candidatus Kuenenia hertensis]